MKVLILAAGRGKRLEGMTVERNKCMIPFRGKPVIEYSLDIAASLPAVTAIVIVVGYRAEDIIGHYGAEHRGKPLVYVTQAEQRGLVHAMETAREALGGEDFLLMLGDEFMEGARHGEMTARFNDDPAIMALCGIMRPAAPAEISKSYTVYHATGDRIARLVEKPVNPDTDIQGTGHCLFRNRIFDFVPRCPVNPLRGEKELPELIQTAVDAGESVFSFDICTFYTNINTAEELTK